MFDMKKEYLDPELNIVLFDLCDVITASGDPGGFHPGPWDTFEDTVPLDDDFDEFET